ncbi:hypothetical protein BBP40_000134 [Aspergillus hancockii]|nr:hypothetical protein BBP40_000134 [Aspergillus hancockii]
MVTPGSESAKSASAGNVPRYRQMLSAAQLERKRAHDREAQKINRQRTKQYIKYLEHQVVELETKLKEYDNAIQQNTKLQHENENLRLQLATIVDGQESFTYSMHYGIFSFYTVPG